MLHIITYWGGVYIFLLDKHGYSPKNNAKRRRKVLKKCIRRSNYSTVLELLKNAVNDYSGYKKDRVEFDITWLHKNEHKFYATA